MEAFKNMMNIIMGKHNLIDHPIFMKPYVDKTYDMVDLARRLDVAEAEGKQNLREELDALALKIKLHQGVRDILEQSKLPILILYDLALESKDGSGTIDYLILSNRFLVVIDCMIYSAGKASPLSISEHNSYILKNKLKELREDTGTEEKEQKMIWPVSLQVSDNSDNIENSVAPLSGKKFSEKKTNYIVQDEKSPSLDGIRLETKLEIGDLKNYLEALFKYDDFRFWLTNQEILNLAKKLYPHS